MAGPELYIPREADNLYDSRGSEISRHRPLFTGDIFHGVAIPGVDEEEGTPSQLAMIISHPCSMRADGVRLRRRVLVARVAPNGGIGLTDWARHHGKFPLPRFLPSDFGGPEAEGRDGTSDTANFSVAFELVGRADGDSLRLDHRVTCLSEVGVAALLQRMIFFQARHAVKIDELMPANVHVWEETELAEEWCEALCPPQGEDESLESFLLRLQGESRQFDAFLGENRVLARGKKQIKHNFRDDLKSVAERSAVRRKVRSEIDRRSKGHGSSNSTGQFSDQDDDRNVT